MPTAPGHRSPRHQQRRSGIAVVVAGVALATLSATPPARASNVPVPAPASFTANARADAAEPAGFGQNEPQVTVDQTGAAYIAWQGSRGTGQAGASRTNDGVNFTFLGNPDPGHRNSGDTALATTSWTSPTQTVPVGPAGSQAVFFSELGTTQNAPCGNQPLNIRASVTIDQGATWAGTDATCQAARVDRNWIAAYTEPKYRGTLDAVAHTWVYQEYHDFVESMIWVTVSQDGGKTWDTINQHPAEQPGGALVTNACNTTPGGIAVDQGGSHPGRVYVAWTTSDAASNLALGCNITEAQPFVHVFISYSDDHGSTWTTRLVWNDLCSPAPPAPPSNPTGCSDDQEIFTPIAIDDAGNVFVAFVDRPDSNPAAPQFDIGVAWSTDGGDTWSGGQVDKPGRPRVADTDVGTHYFPWITAGSNGAVDVVWYGTSYVQGMSQQNKPTAAPGSAAWNVYLGQSLDVIHGAPFVQSKVSDHDMYFGDICTLGIFCGPQAVALGSGGDRILLDDFGIAIGPDGGARVAWTDARDSWTGTCKPGGNDDSNVGCQKTHLYFACQSGGTGLHGETVTGCGQSSPAASVPDLTPLVGFAVGGAIASSALLMHVRRRQLRMPNTA